MEDLVTLVVGLQGFLAALLDVIEVEAREFEVER